MVKIVEYDMALSQASIVPVLTGEDHAHVAGVPGVPVQVPPFADVVQEQASTVFEPIRFRFGSSFVCPDQTVVGRRLRFTL